MNARSVVVSALAVMATLGALTCTEPNPYRNVCGNTVVEPDNGEECDDGADGNSDRGACTLSCRIATCGDGLVQAGVELCDDGSANNVLGPCTPSCEPPRCGDGVLQPPEVCDDGENNKDKADGAGGCSSSCDLQRCGASSRRRLSRLDQRVGKREGVDGES